MCHNDLTECVDPHEQLKDHVSISTINGSKITFSSDPGYSLHGSTTSQCVSGEWTPSPDTVMCIADQEMFTTPSLSMTYEYQLKC
jgi:hypothetical protein